MVGKRRKTINTPHVKFEYLLSYGARRKLLIQEQIAQLHRSFVDRIDTEQMKAEVGQKNIEKSI